MNKENITIEIIPMNIDDLDDIMIIEEASFSIPWSRESFVNELTVNSFSIYICAKCEGKTVGYAGMWKILDEGHITNIAVHPEYRKNKVGSSLVENLISIAKSKNICRLTLEVRENNFAAKKLYEKFGFQAAGIRKEYYADTRENAIIMWKECN